jgi:hypothetical protein
MRVAKPPQDLKIDTSNFVVFLGGSIEMGDAEDWQERLTDMLGGLEDVLVCNPRRDDWDPTWEQKKDNEFFRAQVEWELFAQEISDVNVYYFSPGTKSPITLLELGLFYDHTAIVCCPDGFWRKGNVDIVCDRYMLPQVATLEEVAEWIKKQYNLVHKKI